MIHKAWEEFCLCSIMSESVLKLTVGICKPLCSIRDESDFCYKSIMEIMIYVVFPDVKFISFKSGLAVKIYEILEKICRQYVLIHEGAELLPNLTVGFYKLKYGARIWVVPKNNPSAINRYKLQNCTFDYLVKLFRSDDKHKTIFCPTPVPSLQLRETFNTLISPQTFTNSFCSKWGSLIGAMKTPT